VNEEKAGRWALQPLGNQQQSGNRFEPIQVEDKPFESVLVVFFRADQFGRRRFMLPGQIAEEAPEISAPALLVCGECAFRFGDQVAGSGIQAEGDAAGQKRGSKYELAAGCGSLSGDYHGIAFYIVIQDLRPAKVHKNPPQHFL
jgi:hypothetical protein